MNATSGRWWSGRKSGRSGWQPILRVALTLPFLILFSSGCSHVPAVTKPDSALTRDCDHPEMMGDKWRDLGEAYVLRGEALDECTARMRAIRE